MKNKNVTPYDPPQLDAPVFTITIDTEAVKPVAEGMEKTITDNGAALIAVAHGSFCGRAMFDAFVLQTEHGINCYVQCRDFHHVNS